MSKSPSRKSIIANFGELAAGIGPTEPAADAAAASSSTQVGVPRVGAGVIGATQRAISDIRDERDRLRAIVESGASGSLEIDPEMIDPSPFPDRLPDDNDTAFEVFRRAFESEGQRVPIQVRPHPRSPGRYQVIYGHRRLRAARELGRQVKALIVEMSDHDLVVSQGIENASRQDLSWIERAVFAARMEAAAIKPRDIKAALAIDDAELSRMRLVSRAVPAPLIEAIGRAPKVGRPRWLDLAQRLEARGDGIDRALQTLSADKVLVLGSDERFRIVLGLVKAASAPTKIAARELRDQKGVAIGRILSTPKEFRLVFDNERGAGFGSFLEDELPDLFQQYLERGKGS